MGNVAPNDTKRPRVKRTPEQRAEHRRQYLKQYMQTYRAEHPQKTRAWRIQAAASLLRREGYSVHDPAKGGDDVL